MKILEQKFCNECGGEIHIVHVRPDRTYRITEDGKIIRDNNNAIYHVNNDDPYFVARCSDEVTHRVWGQEGVNRWIDEVERELITFNWK
jgi:hypothetical protein